MEELIMILAWVFGGVLLLLHVGSAIAEYDENVKPSASVKQLRDGLRGYTRHFPIFTPKRSYSLLLCICYLLWFYLYK